MSLTPEELQNIATLARLKITQDDVPHTTADLSKILGLVEQMNKANIDNVEPMSHPFDANQRLRSDVVTEKDQRELFQTIAPLVENGLYLVPKVIED